MNWIPIIWNQEFCFLTVNVFLELRNCRQLSDQKCRTDNPLQEVHHDGPSPSGAGVHRGTGWDRNDVGQMCHSVQMFSSTGNWTKFISYYLLMFSIICLFYCMILLTLQYKKMYKQHPKKSISCVSGVLGDIPCPLTCLWDLQGHREEQGAPTNNQSRCSLLLCCLVAVPFQRRLTDKLWITEDFLTNLLCNQTSSLTPFVTLIKWKLPKFQEAKILFTSIEK